MKFIGSYWVAHCELKKIINPASSGVFFGSNMGPCVIRAFGSAGKDQVVICFAAELPRLCTQCALEILRAGIFQISAR